MPPRLRSNTLENRTQRLKLPIARKPIFVRIGNGLSVGYRRNRTVGTWVLRVSDGRGGNWTQAIGIADDREEADGDKVLNYWQAQDRARAEAKSKTGEIKKTPLTVREAAEAHLQMLAARNPRSERSTRGRLEKKFLNNFGNIHVTSLTKTSLDNWMASQVKQADDQEIVRRSKDSANRVLSMIKAFLNHAVRDPTNGIKDDSAWRLVKPFHGVARPRDIRYSPDEIRNLIKSAPDQATTNLIKGAYLTGARFGELAQARIRDFDRKSNSLWINSGKTGPRNIVLQSEASDFISSICINREQTDFIFIKADGQRWKRSEQTRPFKETLKRANMPLNGSIYALRHSYISSAIEGGIPLNIIAENCGTSVRMIETTYSKILSEQRRIFIEKGAPRI